MPDHICMACRENPTLPRTYQPGSLVSRLVDQGRAEGLAKGYTDGYASGEAESMINGLLIILAARDLRLPVKAYNQVVECTDLDELELWLRRAATADTVAELFV